MSTSRSFAEFFRSHFFYLGASALVIFAVFFFAFQKGIIFHFPQTEKILKVVMSQPLALSSARSSADSVRLALEQAGYKAGGYTIELIVRNDGDDRTGAWDRQKEEANAQLAANDPAVVAYIGPMNSGAAMVSIPILNIAGIAQISQANTWPGLTKSGFAPGEPAKFYPTGVRTYFRDVTTDDLQGPAGALWARELGHKSIFIIDDGGAYGKGIADLFHEKSRILELNILEHQTIDKDATKFSLLVKDIMRLKPDMLYYGGDLSSGILFILPELRIAGYKGTIMASDTIWDQSFITSLGADAEGVLITSVGAPAESLTNDRARIFRNDYLERFRREPEINDSNAYDAANIIIGAMAKSDGTRASVLALVQATKDFPGVYGPLSFDANGDVNQTIMSASVVRNGKFEFVKILSLP